MRLRDDRAADAANELADPARNSRRSVWALADQGIVSLGNCVTNVMLARSLAVAVVSGLLHAPFTPLAKILSPRRSMTI